MSDAEKAKLAAMDGSAHSQSMKAYSNIEGGEYDVLNKLITDKTLDYVNELYIEFHDTKVGRSSKTIVDYLEAKKIKYDIQITGKKPRVNGKKVAWITMKDYY